MAKIIDVEVLGRKLGMAMSCEEKSYHSFTVYAFQPAHGVNLPELCDLLRLSVFPDLKIVALQIGHEPLLLVHHGRVQTHFVDLSRELIRPAGLLA